MDRHSHRLWENREETGLIYDAIGPDDPEFYKTLFPAHYTTSKRPVVRRGPLTTLAVMAAVTVKRAGRKLLAPIRGMLGKPARTRP
jgi:hypothetical protein